MNGMDGWPTTRWSVDVPQRLLLVIQLLNVEPPLASLMRFYPKRGHLLKHIVPIRLAFFLGLYCRDKAKSESLFWQ
jgi:hypothetical protein